MRPLRPSLLDGLPYRLLLPPERLEFLPLHLLAKGERPLEARDLELLVELVLRKTAHTIYGSLVVLHDGLVLGSTLGDASKLCIPLLSHLVRHRLQLLLNSRSESLLPRGIRLHLRIESRKSSNILLRDRGQERRHRTSGEAS